MMMMMEENRGDGEDAALDDVDDGDDDHDDDEDEDKDDVDQGEVRMMSILRMIMIMV